MWKFAVIAIAFVTIVASAVWWSRTRFLSELERTARSIAQSEPARVTDLAHLPVLMRQYVERTGVETGESYRYAYLEQRGQMKLDPDGEWKPFVAEQWFGVSRPAFQWQPSMKMPVGSVVGVDRLEGRQAQLEMRLFGAIPVASDSGPGLIEGELARYMAELVWNPAAIAANRDIEWTVVDKGHVAARAAVGEIDCSVIFEFSADGDVVGVHADARPRSSAADAERHPWGGEFSEYEDIGGIRLPTRGEVYWELPSGRYTYWRGDITSYELH